MKVLIVGGTGMIGGHAAEVLSKQHDVVLGARKPAKQGTLAARFPVLIGDYSQGGFPAGDLEAFDAIVFAAGNDIRHLPANVDENEFWRVMQIEGVPGFAKRAKQAGVRRFVQLGSYYHQVMPHLAESNAYVRARQLADEGARKLADSDFNVSTLNPPSIVGAMPGQPATRYVNLVAWARGERPEVPDFGPKGGTNYMSVRSLSQAVSGALEKAEPGRAYLIGDQNLSFCEFFQMIFDAVGSARRVAEKDEEHPMLPDMFIVQGRGNVLAYEPDPTEAALLGYDRNDVKRAVQEVVATIDLSA